MNITSYNITDIGYHYIGIKIIGTSLDLNKQEQYDLISRNILKYVRDKALKLLLPEPRGTYETIGEKICYELVHFELATSSKTKYELTEKGKNILNLLNNKKYVELREEMVFLNLNTYENLRNIILSLWQFNSILFPIIDAEKAKNQNYLSKTISSLFDEDTIQLNDLINESSKKIEDIIRQHVLNTKLIDHTIRLPLFRSLSDRLKTMRLINEMRIVKKGIEYTELYSVCLRDKNPYFFSKKIEFPSTNIIIFYPEPDFTIKENINKFLKVLFKSFDSLEERAGYYDLPEVRDFVCKALIISEYSFDEALNQLLKSEEPLITVGLSYEGISGKRKPLYSIHNNQIYNLIKKY